MTFKAADIKKVSNYNKITDLDLGAMIFWRNKVLIVKSSSSIQFFRQEEDKEDQCDKWV